MAKPTEIDFFQGRGRPLDDLYAVKEEDWPELWRMPDEIMQHEETDPMAAFADDVVLRAAINAWDNCGRLPGSEQAIAAGILSALSRFALGLNPGREIDPDEAAGRLTGALAGLIRQHVEVAKGGWFVGPTRQ